ncbi:MAG: hypothetical protein IJQ28_05370 [Clostridia bacterium]|nr:hypothetical protein [Clostridia bacterium]
MDDYREILQELDEIDKMCDSLADLLEEEHAENWIVVDKTNMSCVLMNPYGEVRVIGAAYINNAFEVDDEQAD